MTEDDRSPTLDRFLPYAAGIFVLALVIRVIHIFQIRPASFFPLLMGDAQSYHTWAQELAAGDWVGTEVFYQAPLYPYFLGLVYTVFGEGPLVVRMSQAVLGGLACVLLAYAGWRLFSRTAGIVAGVMLACYAPAIFFDSLVQKSVLDAVLLCLTLALLSPLMTRPLVTHSLGAWGASASRWHFWCLAERTRWYLLRSCSSGWSGAVELTAPVDGSWPRRSWPVSLWSYFRSLHETLRLGESSTSQLPSSAPTSTSATTLGRQASISRFALAAAIRASSAWTRPRSQRRRRDRR